MSHLFDLTGKQALVTGGSRGIGLEIARGLVAAGVEVTVASRKADAVESAAGELGCRGVVADLTEAEGCRALAGEIDGPLHILVNNAGASWGAPIEEFPPDAWRKVLTAFMLGTEEGREQMAERVPLGRIGSPEDLVGLTTFLCARAGAYLTGTVIPLDGGITGCA